MAAASCRHFSGYKPCAKVDSLTQSCTESCAHFERPAKRVLLIHLGALGAVVRSTALLPAILRKYPGAHITWVTDAPADLLLKEHPMIDRVVKADVDGVLGLSALVFDVALLVDKSLKSAGVLNVTEAKEIFGFTVTPETGAIVPATSAAEELWEIGLSDNLKFNVNRKAETQLMHEALELGHFKRDPYSLYLSAEECAESLRRRRGWSQGGWSSVVGFNTGCASTIAAKKLSVEGHVKLLVEASRSSLSARTEFVLLGGKEDTIRNREIAVRAEAANVNVIESATDRGLRDGMISVASCDIVVSGDSLGLHMALGFKKPVVAWFGPTCAHELDLYGGTAVRTKAACSPCWKRACEKPIMCYDQVDFKELAFAIHHQVVRLHEGEDTASLEITSDL